MLGRKRYVAKASNPSYHSRDPRFQEMQCLVDLVVGYDGFEDLEDEGVCVGIYVVRLEMGYFVGTGRRTSLGGRFLVVISI